MKNLSLIIDDPQRHYWAGQKLSGTVAWELAREPYAVEVRLFWITLGGTPTQVGVVEKRVFEKCAASGSGRFEFVLPGGPWSFAGSHVFLEWSVEAVILPSRENTRTSFTLGPEGSGTLIYIGQGVNRD